MCVAVRDALSVIDVQQDPLLCLHLMELMLRPLPALLLPFPLLSLMPEPRL